MEPKRTLWIFLFLGLATLGCRAAEQAFDRSPHEVVTLPTVTLLPGQPSLIPTAAAGAGPATGTPPEAGATTAPEAGISPLPTGTPGGTIDLDAPTPAGKPPQSPAAGIRQPELRPELTRLSALLGYQVLDRDGIALGSISDFIVNTCETYIIYFLLDPAEGLSVAAGSQIVTPFEVATINSGVFDAQARTLQLSVAAGQVARAPAYPASLEPVTSGWEAEVRDYWVRIARVSSLTSGCKVTLPGGGPTEIHKVAYAHELIGAVLRDGLGNELGQVEEAILAPESGKLSFFVVRLEGAQGLALIPLRVVNIPKEALAPGGEISLVLLVEGKRLLEAPRINTLEEAVQEGVQGSARAYWNQ